MEFISFAIPFAALVFLTVIVGGLMNYYMDQRGLAFNPYLTYLLLPAIVGALLLCRRRFNVDGERYRVGSHIATSFCAGFVGAPSR